MSAPAAPRRPPRPASLVWSAWVISIAIALLSTVIVAQGVVRDRRIGDATLAIDFSAAGDWQSTPFRVWGPGSYTLFVSSVNHDPALVGAPLAAGFEVSITDPGGAHVFQQTYAPGATGHVLPYNYGDSKLATLELTGRPLRRWTLAVRVLTPDPRFRTAHSQVKFWKARYDPGMGGMVNYVMMFPALVFLMLSLVGAIALARRGFRAPLIVTVASGVVFFSIFAL